MEFIGRGTIVHLKGILQNYKNILCFTGPKVFSLFKETLYQQINVENTTFFTVVNENPKIEEIQIAQDELKDKSFDIIVSFGGGSVIDFAKAFRFYNKQKIPLIAIPTTAGTGSQVTQFAVVYVNNQKTSLEEPSILPEIAIVDSQFVENSPKYLKACSAMDAYCQAIESFWAKNATEDSKKLALQAISICKDSLYPAVTSNSKLENENMALAAHLAGKAINISKTTAAHALSYNITSKYNIPHGHAVSLSIVGLFEFNISSLKDAKRLLKAIGINYDEIRSYFHNLMDKIGLEYNLEKLNVVNLEKIVDNVNIERLNNNPKVLKREDLIRILK